MRRHHLRPLFLPVARLPSTNFLWITIHHQWYFARWAGYECQTNNQLMSCPSSMQRSMVNVLSVVNYFDYNSPLPMVHAASWTSRMLGIMRSTWVRYDRASHETVIFYPHQAYSSSTYFGQFDNDESKRIMLWWLQWQKEGQQQLWELIVVRW